MAKALSTDLRERVVALIESGVSRRQAAERFGVSASSAIRWHQQYRAEGSFAPSKQGGDRRSHRIDGHAETIFALVEERPDITLAEIQAELESRGVRAGIGTLWRFFERHKVTRKKRRHTLPSRSARSS